MKNIAVIVLSVLISLVAVSVVAQAQTAPELPSCEELFANDPTFVPHCEKVLKCERISNKAKRDECQEKAHLSSDVSHFNSYQKLRERLNNLRQDHDALATKVGRERTEQVARDAAQDTRLTRIENNPGGGGVSTSSTSWTLSAAIGIHGNTAVGAYGGLEVEPGLTLEKGRWVFSVPILGGLNKGDNPRMLGVRPGVGYRIDDPSGIADAYVFVRGQYLAYDLTGAAGVDDEDVGGVLQFRCVLFSNIRIDLAYSLGYATFIDETRNGVEHTFTFLVGGGKF